MEVLHLTEAAETLEHVEQPLRAAGAEGELSLGILHRLLGEPGAWGDEVTMMVGISSGRPVSLVTMTGPHPALIVGFTDLDDLAYTDLVDAILATGRRPDGVNGARRWSEPFAQAWTEVAGATVELRREMRALELRSVRRPAMPAGRFRPAEVDDTELLERWAVAFGDEIEEPIEDEQAARTVERLAGANDLTVWESDGAVVSMAAVIRRTPWSSSIALVYTPPERRGRGFASALVALLSQRELDAGQLWCSLFTDAANPTSNHIYTEIGYRPAGEFRYFSLSW
jgi:predicted GNAT family acetyltransferase